MLKKKTIKIKDKNLAELLRELDAKRRGAKEGISLLSEVRICTAEKFTEAVIKAYPKLKKNHLKLIYDREENEISYSEEDNSGSKRAGKTKRKN